jgi:uncharacterized protein (TIGR02145 family)
MKRVFILVLAIAFTLAGLSQVPEKMSYQAVVRNANGELVKSSTVGMKISILQGSISGTAVYVETQNASTNANGLVTIEIGGGTSVTGTFGGIDWSAGLYFIKTETDPTGGTNYNITGTSQLLSVPYALYSKTSGTSTESIALKQQIKILEDNLIAAGTYKLYDIDGNQYHVVKIGTQVWMKENLRVTRFNDGTPIQLVTNGAEWNSLITPAYCWYNNDLNNKETYGALYNGHAIVTGIIDKSAPNAYDVAKDKLCPVGWRVPSEPEWRTLADQFRPPSIPVNVSNEYGYELMETGTSHWINGLGTNTTGFTALPGGARLADFGGKGLNGYFWSSDIDYGHGSLMRSFPLPYDHDWGRIVTYGLNSLKTGMSVRCIKD